MILDYIRDTIGRASVQTEAMLRALNDEIKPRLAELIERWNKLVKDTTEASEASSSLGVLSVDYSLMTRWRVSLTENVTSISFSDPETTEDTGLAVGLVLIFDQDASYTVAGWPSNVRWAEGSAPTIATGANAVTILFFLWDGTDYLGFKCGSAGAGGVTYGSPVGLVVGNANADGVSASVARADHEHEIPQGSPVALTVGGSNVDGASGDFADAAHKHQLPAFGTAAGEFAEGDHTHDAIEFGYYTEYNPDAVPSSAHTDDDECDGGSLDAGWTLWDPGTALSSFSGSDKRYTVTPSNGTTVVALGYYKAVPNTEFSITGKFSMDIPLEASSAPHRCGLFVADDVSANPTTADFRTVGLQNATVGTGVQSHYATWTAYNAAPAATNVGGHHPYGRIRCNGTSMWIDVSPDGISWRSAVTATLGFTPVHCGFFVSRGGSAASEAPIGRFYWIRFKSGAGASTFTTGLPGRHVRYLLDS